MSRFLPFRSKAQAVLAKPSLSDDNHSELENLEHALHAANLIMDDRYVESETLLNSRHSPFHVLGRGIVTFLKATLGFEQDVMKEAQARLATAESVNSAAQTEASKAGNGYWRSEIYDPGTQYAICYAQAQIMSAVVGVLNENVTESLKGFYKVRKAWGSLMAIAEMEARFLRTKGVNATFGGESEKVEVPVEKKDDGSRENVQTPPQDDVSSDDDLEFVDAEEASSAANGLSNQSTNAKTKPKTMDTASLKSSKEANMNDTIRPYDTTDRLLPYLNDPMDIFIHTALSTQYGLLLILISMIPPTFNIILNIIGFRGDRHRGLSLLWQSSSSDSIQGGIAASVILEWYNGLVSFLDIQGGDAWPEHRLRDLLNTMRARFPNSTLWWKEEARMCSAEQDLETSVTMLGPSNDLLDVSDCFDDKGEIKSTVPGAETGQRGEKEQAASTEPNPKRIASLKQIEALKYFERGLDSMYLHAYPVVSACFQRAVHLNNWSHGFYYYSAAGAELEQYRIYRYGGNILEPGTMSQETSDSGDIRMVLRAPVATYEPVTPDRERAAKHAKAATELLEKVVTESGKKRLMARQLPFDVFVSRKIQKWKAIAKQRGIDLVDAITVSPLEELQFINGAHGRMRKASLVESLRRLAFSDGDYSLFEGLGVSSEHQPSPKTQLADDDRATLGLLRSVVLRRLARLERSTEKAAAEQHVTRAREVLDREIFAKYEWTAFKAKAGKLGDKWPLPMARYELAACCWDQRDKIDKEDDDSGLVYDNDSCYSKKQLRRCATLLDEVANWESYDLDSRMGIRVSTGRNTLKKLGIKSSG